MSNTRVVGATLANWLARLAEIHRYKLGNVHCIGHSLGAHICGFIGKQLNLKHSVKIGRITGNFTGLHTLIVQLRN